VIAAVAWANLAVSFLVEVAGLAAFGVWGAQAVPPVAGRWALAIAAPVLAAAVWWLFCAPTATVALPGPVVGTIKLAVLAAATLALVLAGHPRWAILLAAVALTSALLVAVLPDVATG
jgi:hypothetical protein